MADHPFANQAAIVTDAGEGIGLAIAKQLVGQGARVLINDIDPAKAQRTTTGHQALEYLSAYALTKAALEMLAKQLVIELSPTVSR